MRKVLLISLSIFALAFAGDDDVRARFVYTYYSGDFLKAHEQLSAAFSDPILKQIWEERLHHQSEQLKECTYDQSSTAGTRGFAVLKTGDIEAASKIFEDDWLSFLGKSTIAVYKNENSLAREYALKAIELAPERPEPYFFAGNLSRSTDESTGHFLKYLALVKEDPYRKQTVEYAVQFMNRTRGMELNIPSKLEGAEELESKLEDGRLLVKANIDGGKKITLLVDTGAGGLTLKSKKWNPKVETDLLFFGIGKKPVTKGSRVVLTDFHAGQFNVRNPVASISENMSADGIDGIVGTAFFSAGNVMLVPMKSGHKFTLFNANSDYTKQIDSKNFREKIEVPFLLAGKMVMIKGTIRNSPPLDFLLDTGGQRTIISALAAKRYARINYPLSHSMKQTTPLSGVGGRMDDVLVAENVSIQAGPLRKEFNLISVVNLAEGSESMDLEMGGILGRDILQNYTMMIDYDKRTVTFLR
ncbi:MAG TPA: hypothetical protein VLH08_11210 [Acidobacteriota bacterium]|nr:hypothetical protein [Acidobacteriota bacterium]